MRRGEQRRALRRHCVYTSLDGNRHGTGTAHVPRTLIVVACTELPAVPGKTFCEQRPMAGALAARGEVRQSSSSRTGGRFPARVGSLGSTCTAHAHTHARASTLMTHEHTPITLQNTFPQHCTSTTTAHFCMCKLTCSYRSGASGRGGRCWARHGWAPPISGHREPLRGLQPPQHHAAGRFAAAMQNDGWGVSGQRWSTRAERDSSFMS